MPTEEDFEYRSTTPGDTQLLDALWNLQETRENLLRVLDAAVAEAQKNRTPAQVSSGVDYISANAFIRGALLSHMQPAEDDKYTSIQKMFQEMEKGFDPKRGQLKKLAPNTFKNYRNYRKALRKSAHDQLLVYEKLDSLTALEQKEVQSIKDLLKNELKPLPFDIPPAVIVGGSVLAFLAVHLLLKKYSGGKS